MPKKKKDEKKPPAIDITSFLTQPGEEGGEKAETKEEKTLFITDIESMILSYLKSNPRGATKSELYEWSKKKGIKPAEFYKALTRLFAKKALRRYFDPEREEYVFVAES